MLNSFQILGCSGGIPTQDRGVTCLMISADNYDIMIDCGEGSYLRWQNASYQWNRLKYILVTHMHPDHIGGLFPFLFYRKLSNINSTVTIIGPPNLKAFLLDSFNHSGLLFDESVIFINISKKNNIELEEKIKIETMEMKHKIPCWGYALKDIDKKLTFITDTCKNENAILLSAKSDVLIHEATYDNKNREKAKKHFHTTQLEAMEIADEANVKRLILTHFSRSLSNKEVSDWIWNGEKCVIFDERQVI